MHIWYTYRFYAGASVHLIRRRQQDSAAGARDTARALPIIISKESREAIASEHCTSHAIPAQSTLTLTMSSITFRAPVPVARSNGHSRTAARGLRAPLKAMSLRSESSRTKASESSEKPKAFGGLIGAAAAAALALSGPAFGAEVRLPPIDTGACVLGGVSRSLAPLRPDSLNCCDAVLCQCRPQPLRAGVHGEHHRPG